MSKADEMFEKLGFKKICRKYRIIYAIKHDFLIPDSLITFYKKYKWVGANFNLDMQELKAINEKCKELGWIEDKSKQSNLKVIIDGIDTDKIIEETRKEMKEE